MYVCLLFKQRYYFTTLKNIDTVLLTILFVFTHFSLRKFCPNHNGQISTLNKVVLVLVNEYSVFCNILNMFMIPHSIFSYLQKRHLPFPSLPHKEKGIVPTITFFVPTITAALIIRQYLCGIVLTLCYACIFIKYLLP